MKAGASGGMVLFDGLCCSYARLVHPPACKPHEYSTITMENRDSCILLVVANWEIIVICCVEDTHTHIYALTLDIREGRKEDM